MRLLAVRCLHMEDAFLRIVNRVRVEPLGRLFAHGIGHAETAANGYLPDTPAQGCVHICCTKTEHTGAHVGAEPRSNAHAAALRGSAVLPNRCWGLWPRLQPPSVADRAATQRFYGPRGNRSAKRGSVQTGSAWNRKSRTLRQRRRWQSKRLVRFWHPCAVTTRSGLNLLLPPPPVAHRSVGTRWRDRRHRHCG